MQSYNPDDNPFSPEDQAQYKAAQLADWTGKFTEVPPGVPAGVPAGVPGIDYSGKSYVADDQHEQDMQDLSQVPSIYDILMATSPTVDDIKAGNYVDTGTILPPNTLFIPAGQDAPTTDIQSAQGEGDSNGG